MEIGNVNSVSLVGEGFSPNYMESLSCINIWTDRNGMIEAVWDKYRKKTLERVLNDNKASGPIIVDGIKYGKDTISWVGAYAFFPCLHDIPIVEPELFFRKIEEPYNYNVAFLLEHYDEVNLIFSEDYMGLGTWDMVVRWSLSTFYPYCEKGKDLLVKLIARIRMWGDDYVLGHTSVRLNRFLKAQDEGILGGSDYTTALEEIKAGHKKTPWMWYVFPQMKGLGMSPTSNFYGIEGREEAIMYINHPILSKRLIEATEAVLNNENTVYEIFGRDVIKFRSCVFLFSTVSDNPVFKQVIQKYKW